MAAKANAATAEPEVDEAEEETTQPRKKLPLKLIIIAAAAFLVVAGGGTGAYFMFMGKKDKAEEAVDFLLIENAFGTAFGSLDELAAVLDHRRPLGGHLVVAVAFDRLLAGGRRRRAGRFSFQREAPVGRKCVLVGIRRRHGLSQVVTG